MPSGCRLIRKTLAKGGPTLGVGSIRMSRTTGIGPCVNVAPPTQTASTIFSFSSSRHRRRRSTPEISPRIGLQRDAPLTHIELLFEFPDHVPSRWDAGRGRGARTKEPHEAPGPHRKPAGEVVGIYGWILWFAHVSVHFSCHAENSDGRT